MCSVVPCACPALQWQLAAHRRPPFGVATVFWWCLKGEEDMMFLCFVEVSGFGDFVVVKSLRVMVVLWW